MKTKNLIRGAGCTVAIIAALACMPVIVFGQASVGTAATSQQYQPVLIPLPAATLVAGAAGSAGTSTNFINGWSQVTTVTNVSGPLYTNNLNSTGLSGFYYSTNVVSYTNTVYGQFYFPKQTRVALEWTGSCSGSGVVGTNMVFTLAKSVTGRVDNQNQFTWTIVPYAGGTNYTAVTNFSADFLGGAGYLYVIGQSWAATNAASGGTLTNNYGGIYAGLKPAVQ
jgi:hypothetical protein